MDVNNNETEISVNIGNLLVEARENLGLSSQDIATQMNLAFDIIDKIESNHFDIDIPVAFVRGYIKSYATKVGLDTGPMLDAFDKQIGVESPSLKSVQAISQFSAKRKEINSSHYLFKSVSILILLTFLSFAGWELWNRFILAGPDGSDSTDQTDSDISTQLDTNHDSVKLFEDKVKEKTPEPSNNNSLGSDERIQNDLPVSTGLSNDIGSVSHTKILDSDLIQNSGSVQSFQQQTIDTSNLTMTSLVLDFSADCWVKIVDARGEVIALGVKQSGKHMPIEGVAPLNVILGDPSVVTMIYEGLDYDLSAYRAGRRAEIILE